MPPSTADVLAGIASLRDNDEVLRLMYALYGVKVRR